MSAGTGRGFRDVDAHAHEVDFGAYLAHVAAALAAEKAATHDLLEPAAGQRLLDVGCGRGDDVRALAKRVGPGGRVVGVDLSATLIDQAWRLGAPAGVEFVRAEAHRLPFADASFDGARIERTLQHVEDPGAVLAELARVVRPGGIVVASEPDWDTLAIDATDREATRAAVRALCDDRIRHGWIGRQLAGHFRRQRLTAIEVHPATLVLNSLQIALEVLELAVVGTDEWLEDLGERDRGGAFFAAISGYTVKGRVSAGRR